MTHVPHHLVPAFILVFVTLPHFIWEVTRVHVATALTRADEVQPRQTQRRVPHRRDELVRVARHGAAIITTAATCSTRSCGIAVELLADLWPRHRLLVIRQRQRAHGAQRWRVRQRAESLVREAAAGLCVLQPLRGGPSTSAALGDGAKLRAPS